MWAGLRAADYGLEGLALREKGGSHVRIRKQYHSALCPVGQSLLADGSATDRHMGLLYEPPQDTNPEIHGIILV